VKVAYFKGALPLNLLNESKFLAGSSGLDTMNIERSNVANVFARRAARLKDSDPVSAESAGRMAERLDYMKIDPELVADIGCGTGSSLAKLGLRYPQANLLALDLVPELLCTHPSAPFPAYTWRVAGDAATLPLADASVSLLWSNQLLFWLDDPSVLLGEAQRVLTADGLLMFATLGPDTLKELRRSFAEAESQAGLSGRYERTQRFADMHDLGDMLIQHGFVDPVVDMEMLTVTYEDFDRMIGELRAAGSCVSTGRCRSLSGKRLWRAVRAAYKAHRLDGRLHATFEIVYGHAWKAPPGNRTPIQAGSIQATRLSSK